MQIKPSEVETLALNGGRHVLATTTKLMQFFFDLFHEVFPKQKYIF